MTIDPDAEMHLAAQAFALPDRSRTVTDEELTWLMFLRAIHAGSVTPPTPTAIRALWRALYCDNALAGGGEGL